MTLIAVYNSEGCVGRCDARCYEATTPDCECICGGANHGAGLRMAQENTRRMAETWIEQYAERRGLNGYDGFVNPDIWQLPLFAGG